MKLRWAKKQPALPPRRVSDESERATNQYVRSRTISAYTPVPNPDLSRMSAHELRRHRHRLLRILAASLVMIGVLGVLVSQLTAGIDGLSYSPAVTTTPDEAAIKKAANDYYASRPLERLRFLLNEQTLGQYLASKIPEIKGVQSAGVGGLGTTSLALTMRTPVASWNVGGQTLFVDSDGVSFTHNYYAAPLVEVDDESGTSNLGSSAIASSSMIKYIGQLISTLQSNGTGTVQRVVLPAGMIRELDIYLQGRAYRVKVQLDRDVASQAADVKSALTYIDAHGGAGEYVDVRVQGKAFYK